MRWPWSPKVEQLSILLQAVEGTPNYEFVEVNDRAGRSVRIGEWVPRTKFYPFDRIVFEGVVIERGK